MAEESAERLLKAQERELLEALRKIGPVRKLHYFVYFARRTPQCRDVFTDYTKGKLHLEEEEEFGVILIDPAI